MKKMQLVKKSNCLIHLFLGATKSMDYSRCSRIFIVIIAAWDDVWYVVGWLSFIAS